MFLRSLRGYQLFLFFFLLFSFFFFFLKNFEWRIVHVTTYRIESNRVSALESFWTQNPYLSKNFPLGSFILNSSSLSFSSSSLSFSSLSGPFLHPKVTKDNARRSRVTTTSGHLLCGVLTRRLPGLRPRKGVTKE